METSQFTDTHTILTKDIVEKRLAFLEETAAFFNSTNRSVSPKEEMLGERCLYFMEGKAGCAIGRKIADKELCKKMDTIGNVHDVFDLLPDNLRELGSYFLRSVQRLHDSKHSWDELGLTEHGKARYEKIKEHYSTHFQ